MTDNDSEPLGLTTITVRPDVRDDVAKYRDDNDFDNYNAAIIALLEAVTDE